MAEAKIRTIELPAAVKALEHHLGFDAARTKQIARRLQETGLLPAGSQGVSARFDPHDFGTLLLACAAGGTIAEAPDRVAALDRLVPEGRDPSDYPDEIKDRMPAAGLHLDALLQLAAEGDDALRNLRIEIVATWPEFALHWSGGSVERWREPGKDPTHWAASHRRSIMIDGRALYRAVQALFAEKANAA